MALKDVAQPTTVWKAVKEYADQVVETSIVAADSDYLSKASGVSWADCGAQTPNVGTTGLGVTDYLTFGIGYWVTVSANWGHWQSFVRFSSSAFADAQEITAAELRLYVNTEPDDLSSGYRLWVLSTTYGAVDASDWSATGVTNPFNSLAVIDTDDAGNSYIGITLTAAQLAAIPTNGDPLDIRLGALSDTPAEPTDLSRFIIYSHQYADTVLRPTLALTTLVPGSTSGLTDVPQPTTVWRDV